MKRLPAVLVEFTHSFMTIKSHIAQSNSRTRRLYMSGSRGAMMTGAMYKCLITRPVLRCG
jgi:hypothetical protein